MDPELYRLVVQAERAIRAAHNRAYHVGAPFWMRISLGRAQSILMHYVAKHAGDHGPPEPPPAPFPVQEMAPDVVVQAWKAARK